MVKWEELGKALCLDELQCVCDMTNHPGGVMLAQSGVRVQAEPGPSDMLEVRSCMTSDLSCLTQTQRQT